MTNRKRRKLEEMERERRAKKRVQQPNPYMYSGLYPGMMQQEMLPGIQISGNPQGCYFPMGSDGKMTAIQLPPIIQPVAMIPLSSTQQPDPIHDEDDFDEDFDDYDDWY